MTLGYKFFRSILSWTVHVLRSRRLISLARKNLGLAAQFLRSIEFDLGKLELRVHSFNLGGSTVKIRLVRARIDYVKQVALLNDRAGFKMNLRDVAGHSWSNLNRFNR